MIVELPVDDGGYQRSGSNAVTEEIRRAFRLDDPAVIVFGSILVDPVFIYQEGLGNDG